MSKKKKVYIYTTSSCNRRLLDAQKIKDYCEQNGYEIILDPEKADFIVVNSCALNQATEDISVETIQQLKKLQGQLIVAGCLPKISALSLQKIFQGPILSPTNLNKIGGVPNILRAYSEKNGAVFGPSDKIRICLKEYLIKPKKRYC